MRINHTSGVKLDQVRLQYDSFTFHIELEQMNPAVDNVLERSLITLGLQNRNSRRRLFPIGISLPTNGRTARAEARGERCYSRNFYELPTIDPLTSNAKQISPISKSKQGERHRLGFT